MPIVATVGFDLLDMAVLRLIVALSKHHMLVGQEHGRIIPLGEINHPASPFHLPQFVVAWRFPDGEDQLRPQTLVRKRT